MALRCSLCCSHGVPMDAFCPWCDDEYNGMLDCVVENDEPMLFTCPHGVEGRQ